VQAGALIATLVRRDPLLVRFRVAEDAAQRLTRGMAVRVKAGDARDPYGARIVHVGETADATTRMVRVTAEIDAADRPTLRPGTFAEAEVVVSTRADAPVIPQLAIRPSERGFLVFVVDGDVAKERVVELGLRTTDGLVEVKRGVEVGEPLVVRGAEALKDGAKVRRAAPGKVDVPPAAGGKG
jgi:RND family efflux transporter MFP subunit